MAFRYALGAVLLLLSFGLQAQVGPEPTSATDGEVKIHNSRKVFLFRHHGARKSKRLQARVTERQGQSLNQQKQSPSRPTERQGQSVRKQKQSASHHRSRREARVFKRHAHFAGKESTGKSRQRNSRKKHSMARK
jgi:hypothetical protein